MDGLAVQYLPVRASSRAGHQLLGVSRVIDRGDYDRLRVLKGVCDLHNELVPPPVLEDRRQELPAAALSFLKVTLQPKQGLGHAGGIPVRRREPVETFQRRFRQTKLLL